MLENVHSNAPAVSSITPALKVKKNFARTHAGSEELRTAGTMPRWKPQQDQTAQAAIVSGLDQAATLRDPSPSTALALNAEPTFETTQPADDDYSFADVLDIVNPLQHIPLVNLAYRGISGDDIKPAAKIIGSSLYGGPVGAVTSTIDVVIQHETGQDVAGNTVSLFLGEPLYQKPKSDVSIELLLAPSKKLGAETSMVLTNISPSKKANPYNLNE